MWRAAARAGQEVLSGFCFVFCLTMSFFKTPTSVLEIRLNAVKLKKEIPDVFPGLLGLHVRLLPSVLVPASVEAGPRDLEHRAYSTTAQATVPHHLPYTDAVGIAA